MTLAPGTRLGVYEVIAPIGAGGMGEVYRARDTRPELAREVAIYTAPRWSRSGRELIYRAGDSIMAVSYTANGDAFVADKPRATLKTTGDRRAGAGRPFDGRFAGT